MGFETGISWTHHTWSPWWGCTKVSDGCKHCYADSLSNRWGFKIWGQNADRRFFNDKHWNDPLRWNRKAEQAKERRRIFPSMCDPFEDRTDLIDPRHRMFSLIDRTPWLDWLLCTKRPENIIRTWPERTTYLTRCPRCGRGSDLMGGHLGQSECDAAANRPPYHRDNVWLLASIEDQTTAANRVPELLRCRDLAPVLGLSAEPLLEKVDLRTGIYGSMDPDTQMGTRLEGIDWVIVGGESGPSARPMHPDWARFLRDQCAAAHVPFFFKQWGEWQFGCNYYHEDDALREKHLDQPHTLFARQGRTTWNPDIDGQPPPDTQIWHRVGKAAAGDLLDVRQHHEFPPGPPISRSAGSAVPA